MKNNLMSNFILVACIGCTLLLSACNQQKSFTSTVSTGVPEWSVSWYGNHIAENVLLDSVLFQGATRHHITKIGVIVTPLSSDDVSWLVKSPTFGVAVLSNDPNATSFTMIILEVDEQTHLWTGENLGLGSFEQCPNANIISAKGISFPDKICSEIAETGHYPSLETSYIEWISQSHLYLRASLIGTAVKPSESALDFKVNGHDGWEVSSNTFQSIVVPLSNAHLFVFGCINLMAICSDLATQAFQVQP